jgi:hypothetical protein
MTEHSWLLSVLPMVGSPLVFGGCSESTLTPISTTTTSPLSQSPVPTESAPTLQSPLLSPASSPSEVVPFRIDGPVKAGDTLVNGTGPANVPTQIQDVTFMSRVLGENTTNDQELFSIAVPDLEGAHRIGLALGNLNGAAWSEADFYDEAFHGDDAMLVPSVCVFFDTAMVTGA